MRVSEISPPSHCLFVFCLFFHVIYFPRVTASLHIDSICFSKLVLTSPETSALPFLRFCQPRCKSSRPWKRPSKDVRARTNARTSARTYTHTHTGRLYRDGDICWIYRDVAKNDQVRVEVRQNEPKKQRTQLSRR